MTKEFVPYQESLELKELGFDEPCFGYYNSNNEFTFFVDVRSCNTNSEFGFHPTSPTFSQAFRWFREKYNLVSWVKRRAGFIKEYSWYISDFNIDDPDDYDYDLHIETYEEAELDCLRKLIEIVKNKL